MGAPSGSAPDAGGPRREDELRAWIAGPAFTCLGGRAAARRGGLRTVALGDMHAPATASRLHAELEQFVLDTRDQDFVTFVALFDGPDHATELEFEESMWRLLRELHAVDGTSYGWSPDASPDPSAPSFAYSVAGEAFFLVGMHPRASRTARRFTVPAIAFNPHAQFTRMKRTGVYAGLQERIRALELRLQGSTNPMLAEFGEASEARQYSGREVTDAWRCPFPLPPPPSGGDTS